MKPLAQIRFGYGPAADGRGAETFTPEVLMSQLTMPDPEAEGFAGPNLVQRLLLTEQHASEVRRRRKVSNTSPLPKIAPGAAFLLQSLSAIGAHEMRF